MNKLLIVEMIDWHTAQCELEYYGWTKGPSRRIVSIELTEEQIEQLKPKEVGQHGIEKRYEELHIIGIQ